MEQLLKSFPVQDVALAFFLIGVWWSDRRSSSSRRDQGKRIGDLEKAIERIAARAASRSDAE